MVLGVALGVVLGVASVVGAPGGITPESPALGPGSIPSAL